MGNQSYPASSIIGGVSTEEYALRLDSQASDQENCLLSPRFGLCKRPNTTFISNLSDTNPSGTSYVTFPVYHGSEVFYVVASGGTTATSNKFRIFRSVNVTPESDDDGTEVIPGLEEFVVHWPSSQDLSGTNPATYKNTVPAISRYFGSGVLAEGDISHTTQGATTFIASPHTQPGLEHRGNDNADGWTGYRETAANHGGNNLNDFNNDDVYAIWIKSVLQGRETPYNVGYIYTSSGGVEVDRSCNVITQQTSGDSQSTGTFMHSYIDLHPAAHIVASCLSYHLAWPTLMEATNLSTADFDIDTGNNSDSIIWDHDYVGAGYPGMAGTGGVISSLTSTITGRYIGDGTLDRVYADDVEDGKMFCCWKSVDAITELPPRSWENHTVSVGAEEGKEATDFYMRFVNDEDVTPEYTYSGDDTYPQDMIPTTKLPRKGHWEEYCAVGTKRRLRTDTMPHMLIKRPLDNQGQSQGFVFLEGRGGFTVNTQYTYCSFSGSNAGSGAVPNSIRIAFDEGFSSGGATDGPELDQFTDYKPLVINDSIKFKFLSSNPTVPENIKEDTEYYIYSTVRGPDLDDPLGLYQQWLYQISESPGGTPLVFNPQDPGIGGEHIAVTVTTYKDLKWGERLAGDETSNIDPSFLQVPIRGMQIFQNRLVIATDSEICFSGTGDHFQFFRTTVRDLPDSDAFSLAPAATDGAVIKHIVPFKRSLVAITNNAQHVIQGLDGAFSPKSAVILPVSNASCDFFARPVVAENSLFFPFTNESGTGMWELGQLGQEKFAATEITKHVPGYLPKGVLKVVASSKHRMLFVLDDGYPAPGEAQNIYVYSWAKAPDGSLLQNAWTKWVFSRDNPTGSDYLIKSIFIAEDRLVLVTTGVTPVNTSTQLEYIDLDMMNTDSELYEPTKDNFRHVLIDRKRVFHSGRIGTSPGEIEYNRFGNGDTAFELGWYYTDAMKAQMQIVLRNGEILTHANGGLGFSTLYNKIYAANRDLTQDNMIALPESIDNNSIPADDNGFNSWGRSYSGTYIPDTTIAPNGTLTADRIISSGIPTEQHRTNSGYYDWNVYDCAYQDHKVVGSAFDDKYWFSWYFKKTGITNEATGAPAPGANPSQLVCNMFLFGEWPYDGNSSIETRGFRFDTETFEILGNGASTMYGDPLEIGSTCTHPEHQRHVVGDTPGSPSGAFIHTGGLNSVSGIYDESIGTGGSPDIIFEEVGNDWVRVSTFLQDKTSGTGRNEIESCRFRQYLHSPTSAAGPDGCMTQWPSDPSTCVPESQDLWQNAQIPHEVWGYQINRGTEVAPYETFPNSTMWAGLRYNMKSTFGPFAPVIGEKPTRGTNIFVRGARMTYSRSNQFWIDQVNGSRSYKQTIEGGMAEYQPNLKNGELYFGIRKYMPDLGFTLNNSKPWNSMFQGLLYDLSIQEIIPQNVRGMGRTKQKR